MARALERDPRAALRRVFPVAAIASRSAEGRAVSQRHSDCGRHPPRHGRDDTTFDLKARVLASRTPAGERRGGRRGLARSDERPGAGQPGRTRDAVGVVPGRSEQEATNGWSRSFTASAPISCTSSPRSRTRGATSGREKRGCTAPSAMSCFRRLHAAARPWTNAPRSREVSRPPTLHREPTGTLAVTRHYLGDLVYGANDGLITTFAGSPGSREANCRRGPR